MSRMEDNKGEKAKLQSELLKEREKFSLFLSLNTNCFFEYDGKMSNITFAKNDKFSRLSGLIVSLNEEEFVRQTGIFFNDYKKFEDLILSGSDGETVVSFISEDGEYIWSQVKTAIVNGLDGNYQVIGCINDDNDNHKKIEWLREQCQLDPLTKLYNAEYLKEFMDLFFCTEGRNRKSVLFLIDIDNFKRINIDIGRLFGDTVLTNIVDILRTIFKSNSIIGRIGEDKFAVLIKNVQTKEEITILSKTVNNRLLDVYAGGKGNDKITCSMGIAAYPEDGIRYEELLKNAYADLHKIKEKRTLSTYSLDNINEELVDDLNPYHSESVLSVHRKDKRKSAENFELRITNYVQDLLSTTKDIYSALQLLLEKLSKEYNAYSLSIYEKVKGAKKLTPTYHYNRNEIGANKYVHKNQYKDFEQEKYLFNKQDIAIKVESGKSVLQCAFYEEGKFRGMICVEDDDEMRDWTPVEISALTSITRIIAFYLLRLKVNEKIQERLDHMKNYDVLTGMPTLYKFKVDALEKISIHTNKYAIVYMDIEKFKYINDSYGFQFGDRILYDFALAITKGISEGSLAGRISADKFVLMIPYDTRVSLEEWILTFAKEFHNSQKKKHIATNIVIVSGIYLLKKEEEDITSAIDNANIARKAAKGNSSAACIFYNKEMEEQIKKEQEIANDMEDALKNNEFIVYLQPKVALAKETLAGAEALVRWKRPNGELIPPDDFIPLFEKNGFIIQLDFYIYEQVCKLIRNWMNLGIKVIPISVNVSRIHLNEDNFVQRIKNLVDFYSIPPNYIELELTESVFVNDTATTISVMKELRNYGFSVSIDDFGAGYSSLTLLKDMATDVLKLDKEFFSHGEMQREEQIIVSCIINMAKQLDMKVISEGIETEKQTEFLKDISCDMVQGYYYAKPMPVEEFEKFMTNSKNILAKV